MGRRPLGPGEFGSITVAARPNRDGKPNYEARCRYRNDDGTYTRPSGYGQTQTAARRDLLARLDHLGEQQRTLTRETPVPVLLEEWLRAVADSARLAVNTKRLYALSARQVVAPRLAALRVREVTPRRVNDILKAIAAESPASAKTARTVLTQAFDLAVRDELVHVSPVRGLEQIKVPQHKARDLSPDVEAELLDALRSDQRAVDLDLPDLVDFMLATACRVGEALAVRRGVGEDGLPLLDLEAGTVEINATIVRVGGVRRRNRLQARQAAGTLNRDDAAELAAMDTLPPGLWLQPRPKSAAGWRRLALPPWAVDMLHRRDQELRFQAREAVLFPAPSSPSLRDPANVHRDFREVFDRLGYGWIKGRHIFRKTVLTRLLEAGVPPNVVAEQAGHSRASMTLDVYAGRPVVCAAAATVLDRSV